MTQQLYLFIFILVFYLIVFVVRSYLLWKNTGVNPITFGAEDDAHGFNGKLFKIISIVELIVIGIYSFGGQLADYLMPFWYLESNTLSIVGWMLLHFSFIWVAMAQLQMSDSWRIGIDYENKTELVTNGLFSISRNPIFLGIIVAGIGLFFVIPNAFTLLIAIVSIVTIQTQVRLEEVFLRSTHGAGYEKYCGKTRRWV